MKYRQVRHIPQGSLIEISWDDARAGEDGWRNPETLDKLTPARIKSVGYLHRVTRSELVYANDIADDEHVHTSGVIPLGCVRRVKVVP